MHIQTQPGPTRIGPYEEHLDARGRVSLRRFEGPYKTPVYVYCSEDWPIGISFSPPDETVPYNYLERIDVSRRVTIPDPIRRLLGIGESTAFEVYQLRDPRGVQGYEIWHKTERVGPILRRLLSR